MKHTVLISDMGVDGDGSVVVTNGVSLSRTNSTH
jgi:hypothetical protein